MIDILFMIGLTFIGSLLYVCFMVDNSKTKKKRKVKAQTSEPIKLEESKLNMEDYPHV